MTDAVLSHPTLKPLDKLRLRWSAQAVVPRGRVPGPEPVALRQHGDLAHGPVRPRRREGYGWLGAERLDPSEGNLFSVGGEVPTALRGRRSSAVAFKRIEEVLLSDPTAARAGMGPRARRTTSWRSFAVKRWTRARAADKLAKLSGDRSGPSYPPTELAEQPSWWPSS